MIIYGLSGKSGTGKSYNAIELCARMGIEAIIDDGLFIHGGKIIAGISAKKQKTTIRAIKTAIFENEEQCADVQAAIKRIKPKSILVLGTSDEMVLKIAGKLGLPEVSEFIHIEDISTQAQIHKAQEQREKGGMHVIPAPTVQVRKQFSGYFLDPKKSFRKAKEEALGGAPDAFGQTSEKTVMRPKYSYFGKYDISETVISDIASYIVEQTPGAAQLILAASSADADNNMYIRAIISANWGARLRDVAQLLQQQIVTEVTRMTNFNILGVEVEIRNYKM